MGKGSRNHISDFKAFSAGWDAVFGKVLGDYEIQREISTIADTKQKAEKAQHNHEDARNTPPNSKDEKISGEVRGGIGT